MAYTHAYMMKKNLMDMEYMARTTNEWLRTTDSVMPWESDLVSQAATNLRSVYRYRKYKDRFGHTHRIQTPFCPVPLKQHGTQSQGYGGCGTFFGLTKDPTKRACYLEKKIAKSAPKCAQGKTRHCDKVSKWEAELISITGGPVIAEGTAADFALEQALAAEQQAISQAQSDPSAALKTILPLAALAGALIVAVAAATDKL